MCGFSLQDLNEVRNGRTAGDKRTVLFLERSASMEGWKDTRRRNKVRVVSAVCTNSTKIGMKTQPENKHKCVVFSSQSPNKERVERTARGQSKYVCGF